MSPTLTNSLGYESTIKGYVTRSLIKRAGPAAMTCEPISRQHTTVRNHAKTRTPRCLTMSPQVAVGSASLIEIENRTPIPPPPLFLQDWGGVPRTQGERWTGPQGRVARGFLGGPDRRSFWMDSRI